MLQWHLLNFRAVQSLYNVRLLFPPQGGTICLAEPWDAFFSPSPSSKCGAFLKPSSLWIKPGEWTFRALIILGHLASFSYFHLFKLFQTLPVPSYHCFHFIPFDQPHHSSFRASLVKYILKVKKWVNIWNLRLPGETRIHPCRALDPLEMNAGWA